MIIYADYLLAMILSAHNSVSFEVLSGVQRSIEDLCPGVAVDLSSPAVRSALEYYPEIFEQRGESIARTTDAQRYLSGDYVHAEFVKSVPADVHNQVREAIRISMPSS